MKKTLSFLVALLIVGFSFSQSDGINYKALIKDGGGNVVANQNITIQFQILEGAGMTNVYQETHSPNTDANGIIIINIGEGTPNSGNYSTIDWGSDDHYLNVKINTGSGLTDMGTTQFMAVPYSLHAEKVETGSIKIDDLSDGKSDSNGSSVFLGVNAGLNDDATYNNNVGIGFEALKNNTSGSYNLASGNNALFTNTIGSWNTAVGYQTLFSNTTGGANTAVGYQTLYNNTTGYYNTANGYQALYNNTFGYVNTANGNSALYSNTSGSQNTANGNSALYSNTSGSHNTANGNEALLNNTEGSDNTAIGYESLYTNTTGVFNTANGKYSLYLNTSGQNNTACGYLALFNNSTGFRNTATGVSALSNNTTGDNNTAIGYDAQVPNSTSNNQVRIGNTDVTYAGVQVSWTVTSDKRWKESIRDLPYGLDVLKQLKPVDYIRKNNEHKTREMGFIAQDVEALLTKISYKDQGFLSKDDKGFMSLRYNDFIALLTKAIQDQQEIIETQNNEIQSLKADLGLTNENQKALDSRLKQIEKVLKTSEQ